MQPFCQPFEFALALDSDVGGASPKQDGGHPQLAHGYERAPLGVGQDGQLGLWGQPAEGPGLGFHAFDDAEFGAGMEVLGF